MQLMRKKSLRVVPQAGGAKVRQKCEDRGEPSTLVVLQLPAVGFVCGRMSRGCRNQRGQILSESGAAEPGPSSGKVMAQNKRNSTARHFPCAPPSPFGRFSWGRRICGACPVLFTSRGPSADARRRLRAFHCRAAAPPWRSCAAPDGAGPARGMPACRGGSLSCLCIYCQVRRRRIAAQSYLAQARPPRRLDHRHAPQQHEHCKARRTCHWRGGSAGDGSPPASFLHGRQEFIVPAR